MDLPCNLTDFTAKSRDFVTIYKIMTLSSLESADLMKKNDPHCIALFTFNLFTNQCSLQLLLQCKNAHSKLVFVEHKNSSV